MNANRKLTMVSVTYRGRRMSLFMHLPVDSKGHTYIDRGAMHDIAAKLGCGMGETYSYG